MDSLSSLPKALAFQFYQRFSHTQNKQQRIPIVFLLLVSLSSLYFLTSKSLDFIWVFAFFAALVICLTLALPNFRSVRIFFSKSYPLQASVTNSDPSHAPHVVWSIGSNPKWDKSGISGYWVKGFSNGDVYEGEFHRGKCSGSGVYHYYMCGKYEGDWVDGKYDGYGVETWAKGSRYRGQYRNGLRHGVGMYKFYTGDIYEGEWSNGQSHGCGVYSSKDGCKYVGEFKWGIKHGFGHYHYRNGDVYAGEYFADKIHGFGVYKFGNGHQYEGSWHEGRRQGFGVYTFRNAEIQSGYWQNGLLDKVGNHAELPGAPSSSNSCKISKVVEEARQASKKAYAVTMVDIRVNTAIVAANRAANAARVAAVKAVQNGTHESIIDNEVLLPGL